MKTIHRNEEFVCTVCEAHVPKASSSCRDHCTACLSSLHVDDRVPGDRASACGGVFVPEYAVMHQKKGIMIHYRCARCNRLHQNRAAEDDDQEVLAGLLLEANRRAARL